MPATPRPSLLAALNPSASGHQRASTGAMPAPTLFAANPVPTTDAGGVRVKVPGGQTGKPTNTQGSFDTSGMAGSHSALTDLLNLDLTKTVQDGLGQVAQLLQSTVDSAHRLVQPVLDNASRIVTQTRSTLNTITANTTATTQSALNTLTTAVANTVHSVQTGGGAAGQPATGGSSTTGPPPAVSTTTPASSDVHSSQTTPAPHGQPPQTACGNVCTLQSIASSHSDRTAVTTSKVTMSSTSNSDGPSDHSAPVPAPAQSTATTSGSTGSAGGHTGGAGQAYSDLASLKLPGISNTGSSTSDAWILPSSLSFEPGHSPD